MKTNRVDEIFMIHGLYKLKNLLKVLWYMVYIKLLLVELMKVYDTEFIRN